MSTTTATPTIAEVEALAASGKLRISHTASRRGYLSRKTRGYIEPYNGRYGKGYIHVEPRFDTTQYVSLTYYIEA